MYKDGGKRGGIQRTHIALSVEEGAAHAAGAISITRSGRIFRIPNSAVAAATER